MRTEIQTIYCLNCRKHSVSLVNGAWKCAECGFAIHCSDCDNHGMELVDGEGKCTECGRVLYHSTNDEILKHIINTANENADQRESDKRAIGVSDYRRIEAYRMGQIIAGCREYPGEIEEVVWAVLPYPYHRDMTDDEINALDYNILDRDGKITKGKESKMEKTSIEAKKEQYELAIKYNNCAANDPCGICGGRSDPQILLALFLPNTYHVVCDPCGQRYAPELYEMIRHFYATGGDATFERRIHSDDNVERSTGTESQTVEGGQEQERLPKLYSLSTLVDRYETRCCVFKDVTFSWYISRDKPPVPYKEAILNYEASSDRTKQYEEGAVDELFTEAEAKVFAAYLLAIHGDTVSFKEVPLPWDCKNLLPTGAIPAGGGQDHYMIYREAEYNLNFKVLGYYDVRGLSPINESTPVNSGIKTINAKKTTQTRKRYLTLEDDFNRIVRQREDLENEGERLRAKLASLKHDHFKCVKEEVHRLLDNTPKGDQVTVDLSLLKEILDYFNDYESGRMLPSCNDMPF